VDWTAFAAALKARVKPIDPYAVLGVPPTASDDEVKTAYREQQRLNHPDLVARMSPEIQKVAHERTQAINEAYRTIMELRRKK
jgi:DnaJ like chaperone protein